jgi:rSAM/selenodomain-associated transferase 2
MISNISIIVPTLNEATNLPGLLPAAKKVKELLVVDGGSSDNTLCIAKELGFKVIKETGSGGRGKQLNTGAAEASGSLLLFLHADTLLPLDFPNAVSTCLAKKGNILGSFQLQVKDSSMLLKFVLLFTNIRSKFLQLPYGDQSFFIRKQDFIEIGGFPEIPIMEDYIFVKQAKKRGEIVTLNQKVITSARRWQRLGVLRTTITNQLVVLGYYLGIKPETLAAFYRKK